MKRLSILGLSAGTALLCAVPVSLQLSQGALSLSVDTASAGIEEPGYVVGVHRRAARRAARRAHYRYRDTAVAPTPYPEEHWGYWNGAAPAYGAATVGLPAGAAASSAAYYSDSSPYAGANYVGWNGGINAYRYPTRAMYGAGYMPPSYYGPVCNPRYDNLCQ